MAIVYFFFSLYIIWAFPAMVGLSYFLIKSLSQDQTLTTACLVSFFACLVIFTPVMIPARFFFDDMYMPWYAGLALAPPTPTFSLGALGLSFFANALTQILLFGHFFKDPIER